MTTSWSKLLSTLQCFMAGGEFIGTLPTHSQYKFLMKRFTISKIFSDHLDLRQLKRVMPQIWIIFHLNIYDVQQQARQGCSRYHNAYWPGCRHRLCCEKKKQSKKTLLLTPAAMWWTTLSSPLWWLQRLLSSSTWRIKKSSQKTSEFIYSTASVAITAGGAVLNAVALNGGN